MPFLCSGSSCRMGQLRGSFELPYVVTFALLRACPMALLCLAAFSYLFVSSVSHLSRSVEIVPFRKERFWTERFWTGRPWRPRRTARPCRLYWHCALCAHAHKAGSRKVRWAESQASRLGAKCGFSGRDRYSIIAVDFPLAPPNGKREVAGATRQKDETEDNPMQGGRTSRR